MLTNHPPALDLTPFISPGEPVKHYTELAGANRPTLGAASGGGSAPSCRRVAANRGG